MAAIMKNMKVSTVEMIERMPEKDFEYRPADSVKTFREQVQHMISVNYFLFNHYFKLEERTTPEIIGQQAAALAKQDEKPDLIGALKQQFDELISFYEQASPMVYQKKFSFGTPEEPLMKDYFSTAMLIRDHLTHHRAQLAVYLRLKGIEPALYRGF
jgi:uncharacterized damage-inducible protein DinB